MKEISLNFKGYRRDEKKDSLEERPGIYCVYRCLPSQNTNSVSLKELLYIGESDNICKRLENHNKYEDWRKHLKRGETLCYSRAFISGDDRLRAEAALIYYHEPPENTEHIDHFGYPDTKIVLSGEIKFLENEFIVYKD